MSDDTAETVWTRPRSQGKSWVNKQMERAFKEEAKRIDREIMDTLNVSGKLMHDGDCVGTVTQISFGNMGDSFIAPNHKTVFCTYNSYNLNRKTIIL